MIRIKNYKIEINKSEKLKDSIKKKYNINCIDNFKIIKKSIDARKKEIFFIYTLEFDTKNEKSIIKKYNNIEKVIIEKEKPLKKGTIEIEKNPVIIGFGPSGMFAALTLVENGFKPIIFERGEKLENRVNSVNKFWENNILNEESNVQYGEGGAGTFSDGKLTTRVKDKKGKKVLESLINFGAPKEILYEKNPHIGTDNLRKVVKNIREYLIQKGATINFNSKMTDLSIKNGKINEITINDEKVIETNLLILAIGNSSRDTYINLYKKNILMESKNFAVGFRIEHKRIMIDKNQYKENFNHKLLKSASYRLTHKTKNDKGVYTFCMCPGGVVVAATSLKNRLVTNGMSYYKRDKENSNSAILVTVSKNDFGNNILDGLKYQDELEKKAFIMGGKNYKAPCQLVKDYIENRQTIKLNEISPTYQNGIKLCNLNDLFSKNINEALKEGLLNFENKIKGFCNDSAVITGVETRTSSPITIKRNKDSYESVNVKGIFPVGEGSGYAGGIMSSAIDGIKLAEKIIETYILKTY